MGLFGWSLPPGCGTLPGEEDYPCAVCGKWEDDCICGECPECEEAGNPKCYVDHGMTKTEDQIKSLKEAEAQWAKQNEAEATYMPPQEEEEY